MDGGAGGAREVDCGRQAAGWQAARHGAGARGSDVAGGLPPGACSRRLYRKRASRGTPRAWWVRVAGRDLPGCRCGRKLELPVRPADSPGGSLTACLLPVEQDRLTLLSNPSAAARQSLFLTESPAVDSRSDRHGLHVRLMLSRSRNFDSSGTEFRRPNQIPNSSGSHDQPQLSRRRHVARERRGGDDGGTREVAFAAESHPVLPVAIERRDRAFARRRARRGPGRNTGRTTTAGSPRRPRAARWRSSRRRAADRAARSPVPTPPEPGNTSSGVTARDTPCCACAAQDECGLQQVVVPAVGARADHAPW